MDSTTPTNQESERGKRAPVRSSAFLRVVRMVLPHRRLLITGISASVVYALLHSVSILGALPILKTLLEEEGLHGWVDRAVAGMRMDVTLTVREASLDTPQALIVQDVKGTSEATHPKFSVGDEITALNNEELAPRLLLVRLAELGVGEHVTLGVSAPGSGASRTVDLTSSELSLAWQAGSYLTSLLPREQGRDDRVTTLAYVLGSVVIIVIIANGCRFISQYFVGLGVLMAMLDLRRKLYRKVLNLPMSYFTRDVGDIVSRMVQDVQDVQRGVMSLFGKMIREPLKAIFILAAALWLDWQITITMVVIAPIAVLIFWRVGASIKKANKKLLRGYGAMIAALSETLSTIGVIKAYTGERLERRRLWNIDRRMFHQQVKILRLESVLSPALEVIGVVGVSAATVWLGSRVIAHEIDASTSGALIAALATMFDPLRKMADVYTRVQRSSAGAERLCELLDAVDESELHEQTALLESLSRDIEFRDVSFAYPETDTMVLDHVSLTVRAGETIALVGPNGAGKTTLVNMLTRFYEPQSGSVLFDGIDIRTVPLGNLRRQIGLVTQDSVVFPIPLVENIAYGTRNGSRETVIAAAERAYADEFISTLPQGYDTIPGDMGKTLSGGQRQRIAIARAVLRDAPILIFDEATSQIDSESEQRIQIALRDFSKDRTTFIVAHRLSTIRFADRIVVMEAGKIIATGTHGELFESSPLYRTICETQLLA